MKTCTFVATALVAATTATAFGAVMNNNMVVVGTYETLTVNITADTTWEKPVFVAGTLRKIGAGILTLRGEKIFGQGRIEVADGEMAITATGVGSDAVSEPAILRNGAAMWLDAGMHVAGPTGAAATGDAATWYDVRDTAWGQQGFSPSHIYAQSSTNLAINSAFPQTGSDEAGRDFVFFGGYGSGRWAQWRKPDDTKAWIPIYHSFVAYNPNGSHGHYLGCSAQESGDAERQCYFAVNGGTATNRVFIPNVAPTAARSLYNYVRYGRVFRDGEKIDPAATINLNAVQILETESYISAAPADTFFSFKDYQGNNGNRLGGGRLHEVAIFTNRIDELDRVLVEQYLLRKWVNIGGYTLPSISVAPGATLTMQGCLAGSSKIDSRGTVKWTGTSVSMNKVASPFTGLGGSVSIEAGTTAANAIGAAIGPKSGENYAIDAKGIVSVSSGTVGVIGKTGAGTIALAGLDSADKFSLLEGAASLRPVLTNVVAMSADCIDDGGFEGILNTTGYKDYASGTSLGKWVSSPYAANGVTRISYKTGWGPMWKSGMVLGAPEGDYFLVLKMGGGVSQSVTLPKDGRYEITMRTYARSDYTTHSSFARVYVDGIAVGTVQARSQEKDWDVARLVTPWLSSGEHDVKFVSEFEVDIALGIDDIHMVWLDDSRDMPLANGNFENVDWAKASSIQDTIRTATILDSNYISGWSASGNAYIVRRSPYLRQSSFNGPENDSGSFSAILTNGVSLSQTITISETGLYRLSALAGRFDPDKTIAIVSGTDGGLVLTLGETSETFLFSDWALQQRRLSSPVLLQAGQVVNVSVAAANIPGAMNGIAVDDVRLVRENGNLVINGGFENGGSNAQNPYGWTVLSRPPISRDIVYAGPNSSFGNDIIEGNCRARLHAGTHIEQTLPLESGLYRLSFWEVSRVHNGVVYCGPSPLCVTLASGAVTNFSARVMPSNTRTSFLRHEYLLRVPVAGNYDLGFEAIVQGNIDEDKTSMIDAVCLIPVRDIPCDAVPTAFEEVAISVSSGAKLGLDWPGIMKAGALRCAGRSLTGGVSAADAPDMLEGIGSFDIRVKCTVICVR